MGWRFVWRGAEYGELSVNMGRFGWISVSRRTFSLDVILPYLGVSLHRWRDGRWKVVKILWVRLLNVPLTPRDHVATPATPEG